MGSQIRVIHLVTFLGHFFGDKPLFFKNTGVPPYSDYILKSKLGIHGPAAYAGIHEPLNRSKYLKGCVEIHEPLNIRPPYKFFIIFQAKISGLARIERKIHFSTSWSSNAISLKFEPEVFQNQLKEQCGDTQDYITANITKYFDEEFKKQIRHYKIEVIQKLFFAPISKIDPIPKLIQFWNCPYFDPILIQFCNGPNFDPIFKLDQNWVKIRTISKLDQNWDNFKIGSKLGQFPNWIKIVSKLGQCKNWVKLRTISKLDQNWVKIGTI